MLFFAQNALTQPGQLHFFQLSHICKANEMFCSEKKEGAGGWFWRSGESGETEGGMRHGEPGPRWTTKGPVSQCQLHAGGEGSQERPWLEAWPSTQHQNRLHIDCSWQKATRCSSSQSPQRSGLNNQLYKHPASLSKVGQKGSSHFEFSGVYMSNTRHAHTGVQLRLDLSEEWIQTPTDGFQSWN